MNLTIKIERRKIDDYLCVCIIVVQILFDQIKSACMKNPFSSSNIYINIFSFLLYEYGIQYIFVFPFAVNSNCILVALFCQLYSKYVSTGTSETLTQWRTKEKWSMMCFIILLAVYSYWRNWIINESIEQITFFILMKMKMKILTAFKWN